MSIMLHFWRQNVLTVHINAHDMNDIKFDRVDNTIIIMKLPQ